MWNLINSVVSKSVNKPSGCQLDNALSTCVEVTIFYNFIVNIPPEYAIDVVQ